MAEREKTRMPTTQAVQQAIAQLELQGTPVSIENVRSICGGSPRDIGPLIKAIREQPEAPAVVPRPAVPPPSPALTLTMLQAAARQCVLARLDARHPGVVLDRLNHEPVRYSVHDLWTCLLPHITDERELSAITWKLRVLAGQMQWSQGEAKVLDTLWQRLVVQPIGHISAEERAVYEQEQFAQLAQRRREAAEHERRRSCNNHTKETTMAERMFTEAQVCRMIRDEVVKRTNALLAHVSARLASGQALTTQVAHPDENLPDDHPLGHWVRCPAPDASQWTRPARRRVSRQPGGQGLAMETATHFWTVKNRSGASSRASGTPLTRLALARRYAHPG